VTTTRNGATVPRGPGKEIKPQSSWCLSPSPWPVAVHIIIINAGGDGSFGQAMQCRCCYFCIGWDAYERRYVVGDDRDREHGNGDKQWQRHNQVSRRWTTFLRRPRLDMLYLPCRTGQAEEVLPKVTASSLARTARIDREWLSPNARGLMFKIARTRGCGVPKIKEYRNKAAWSPRARPWLGSRMNGLQRFSRGT
jgi:hypothetical protein